MELSKNETLVGKWGVNFVPPQASGIWIVKLFITDKRILMKVEHDLSIGAAVGTYVLTGMDSGENGSIYELDVADILSVEQTENFFMKGFNLLMRSGEVYTFKRGLLGVNRIIKAIESVSRRGGQIDRE
ncbi:MAG: hypothetical protein OEZ43_05745 [Gammaproteobacteria bacterium]|nr:hypothetical protein [Gammaproteobacteria bacterium]